MRNIYLHILLIVFSVLLVAMDYPSGGTDHSSYFCEGGQISTGDSIADFFKKCGAPNQTGRGSDRANPVWAYLNTTAREVDYFEFSDNQLERIYSVKCLTKEDTDKDPNCAKLQNRRVIIIR